MSIRPKFEIYKKIMKWDPLGIIISESSPIRKPSHLDIMPEWRKYGSAPMVHISFKDAYKLVKRRAERAHLTLIQEERAVRACNIVFEKEGYKYPDETIIVCGHYDSVYGVAGAIDNAGGVALVLELARVFKKDKIKRNIRFILFSGEELEQTI